MGRKKLPVGVQSFENIITGNYYYVDKTYFVYELVNSGKAYFLSRPRRFGKSLFLDTLKQAFLGKKELFEGLFLEKNWDWSVSYPVIHIDFGGAVYESIDHLNEHINQMLLYHADVYGVNIEKNYHDIMFSHLIRKIRQTTGQKVVVLVDEYDKPILDNITDSEKARQMREILKNLYSVLKPMDEHLKFVMLTGVSKFSKVSIFSGLNQLNDITVDREFSTICGYTEKEFLEVFRQELEGEDIQEIRDWYNGYSFCGEKVYNPFDVLLYMSKREFRPYWFETGTPDFLIKLLMEKRFRVPYMENMLVTERLIGSFDVDFVEPENILFQTGYLTIKECINSPIRGVRYIMGYPNKEVKISLNDYIVAYYTQANGEIERLYPQVEEIFITGNVHQLERVLRSLFASIPNDWYRKNRLSEYEGYYASVVYSFLAATGLTLIAEDTTNTGRIDLTVLYEDKVYIIEFKVLEIDEEKKGALQQIREKSYYEKYAGRYKDIYLIGIEFSRDSKNIQNFQWEKVKNH